MYQAGGFMGVMVNGLLGRSIKRPKKTQNKHKTLL